mgnify:CR=1 FL=1
MDIEESLNQFINDQLVKFPTLTDWDVKNLKIGFAGGCEYFIRSEIKALEAKGRKHDQRTHEAIRRG